MGKENKAPPTPPYAQLAQMSEAQSQRAFDLSQEQLDWTRDQYSLMAPQIAAFTNAQLEGIQFAQNAAKQQQGMYLETYAPLEEDFANKVKAYGSPEFAAQQSAAAQADVVRSIDQQQNAAKEALVAHGLNPSDVKFNALDAGYRIAKALGGAAAGTESRLDTQRKALALESEAISTGRGFPGAGAGWLNAGTSAGTAGARGTTTGYATGAEAMGTPVQYGSLGMKGIDTTSGIYNNQYTNQLAGDQFEYGQQKDTMTGIGNIIGAGLSFAGRPTMPWVFSA